MSAVSSQVRCVEPNSSPWDNADFDNHHSEEEVIEAAIAILSKQKEVTFYVNGDRDPTKTDQENHEHYYFESDEASSSTQKMHKYYITDNFLKHFKEKAYRVVLNVCMNNKYELANPNTKEEPNEDGKVWNFDPSHITVSKITSISFKVQNPSSGYKT